MNLTVALQAPWHIKCTRSLSQKARTCDRSPTILNSTGSAKIKYKSYLGIGHFSGILMPLGILGTADKVTTDSSRTMETHLKTFHQVWIEDADAHLLSGSYGKISHRQNYPTQFLIFPLFGQPLPYSLLYILSILLYALFCVCNVILAMVVL